MMGQLVNILLTIDKVYTVPQRALDCGPGLGRLNKLHNVHSNMQTFSSLRVFLNILLDFTQMWHQKPELEHCGNTRPTP